MNELMHENTHVYGVPVLFQGGQQKLKVPVENPFLILSIVPTCLGQHSEYSFEYFSDLIFKSWVAMER